MHNAEMKPLEGKPAKSQHTEAGKGWTVIRADPLRQAILAHGGVTDRIDMEEIGFVYSLAANHITGMGVRDGQRIAALAITRSGNVL